MNSFSAFFALLMIPLVAGNGTIYMSLTAFQDSNVTVRYWQNYLNFSMLSGDVQVLKIRPHLATDHDLFMMSVGVDRKDTYPRKVMIPLVQGHIVKNLGFDNDTIFIEATYVCDDGLDGVRCQDLATSSTTTTTTAPSPALEKKQNDLLAITGMILFLLVVFVCRQCYPDVCILIDELFNYLYRRQHRAPPAYISSENLREDAETQF